MKFIRLLFLLGASATAAPLPPRPAEAPGGAAFAKLISTMPLAEREAEVRAQFAAGNVPDTWRQFVEVTITRVIAGREHTAVLRVAPDYLAIGSDADRLLMPVTPATAEALAAQVDCTLPTRRMVDEIYRAAAVKHTPFPLPPGPEMTTAAVFAQHSRMVPAQPGGALTAGHKKDVVLTPLLAASPGKVAIYGWHRKDGTPIQSLYLGHTAAWVDYSHGVRFVQNSLTLDGQPTTVAKVLADPAVCELLSDEGPFTPVAYAGAAWPAEQITELTLPDGVRAVLNAPAALRDGVPLRLVLYGAPAGNTIEQTFGRRTAPGGDWRCDIQHITAQTRWLRMHDSTADLAVAVLQCEEKSWPAWRKARDPDNRRIPGIVDAVRGKFATRRVELVLSGHSAGGSFVFGYMDALPAIPADVTRIAFLDSNYAYSAGKGHADKLTAWLRGGAARSLCVLAYHDSHALLDGKSFVSETGGTWGRSHAMLRELPFQFTATSSDNVQRHTALDGRIQFLLRENPERKVLHTRLVEWNGFIHSQLSGTALERQGYQYPAPRVYDDLIPDK